MGLIAGKLNTFEESTLLFEDGDEIEYIAYIKSGSILNEGSTGDTTYIAGEFICARDLYNGFYDGDYTASAGSEILIIPATSPSELFDFLSYNPELQMNISYELCVFATKLYDIYQELYNDIEDFYYSIILMHQRYIECSRNAGVKETEFLEPHSAESYKFSEQPFYKSYMIFSELSKSKPKAHTVIKANGVKFLKVQNELIRDIYTAYDDMVYYLKTIISLFASKSELCLFSLAAGLAEKASGKYKNKILNLLKDMKQIIENIDSDIRNNSGLTIDIDYNRVSFYFMMVENMDESSSSEDDDDSEFISDSDVISTDFDDSQADTTFDEDYIDYSGLLRKLCTFAGFDDSKYQVYDDAIIKFLSIPDKNSTDDEVRLFRKAVSTLYFELYEEVFIKYLGILNDSGFDSNLKKLIELFLDFSFIDERLLTDSQINYLLTIPELSKCYPCNIYRMKDWLIRIYNGEEPPSKSEFDLDYVDYIRERKKTEAISPEKERELLSNNELKVRFEIQNIFRYNLKLLSGNLLGFFPMLHMDSFDKEINKLLLTSETINECILKLLQIDYSIFYREMLYSDEKSKISKAYIQKQFYPNIILFPTAGNGGVMWQETAGKRIGSSGRFLLPSLFFGNIEDVLLALFGRFRFELCKSLYGGSWNNIQVPSLTSEYCDYIQFYRKNKELTTEKKEALKNQISRCRNNTREIFVYDYLIWMKYEAAGAIRLNKVARRILATYCPFAKEIRAKIASQPIFADAMTKYQREKIKKTKEINNQIIAINRANGTITEEIEETKHFYEDL